MQKEKETKQGKIISLRGISNFRAQYIFSGQRFVILSFILSNAARE